MLSRRSIFGLLPGIAAAVSLPAIAVAQVHERPEKWIVEVEADNMAPTMCRGDKLIVRQCRGFEGGGVYLVDNGGAEVPYRAWRSWEDGKLRLLSDNRHYAEWPVSDDWFVANVRGRVESATRQIWWG